ncbi:MAG: hypothetical protein HY055_02020 [Magnetospirillum sp.]|nr:hypothetical protein [Magnetospirillum sp.]
MPDLTTGLPTLVHFLASAAILAVCLRLDLRGTLSPIPFASLVALDYLFFFSIFPALGDVLIAEMLVPVRMTPATIALTLGGEALLLGAFYAVQAVGSKRQPFTLDISVTSAQLAVGWGALAFAFAFDLFPMLRALPSLPQMERPIWLAGATVLFFAMINRRLGRIGSLLFVMAFVAKFALLLRGGLASPAVSLCFVLASVLFVTRRWRLLAGIMALATILVLSYVPIKRVHNLLEGRRVTSAADVTLGRDDGPASLYRSLMLVTRRSTQGLLLQHVIDKTPSQIPYWEGSTLVNLVTNNVPRFLWPNKPEERLGNRFAAAYHLINDDDNETSWNVPWLVEFYINFGRWGALACMAAAGTVLGLVTRAITGRPLTVEHLALAGAVVIPLFHTESNVSLLAGNLIWVALALLAGFALARRIIPGPAAGA